MQTVKQINAAIAFCLELCMLYAVGYCCYHLIDNLIIKWLVTIGLPLLIAILWGVFAAPRSDKRLPKPQRIVFKLLLYGATAALIYAIGDISIAIAFFVVALANVLIGA